MKILVTGPPQGHNIKLYLDFFDRYREQHGFEITYVSRGKRVAYFDQYEHFTLIDYVREFPRYVWHIATKLRSYDLIWVHNWTFVPVILSLMLFRKKGQKMVFSVWSEPVPRKAVKGPWSLHRYIFHKVDVVHCQWKGTLDIINKGLPNVHTKLIPWGLSREYFEEAKAVQYHEFTEDFVANLPKDKLKFFWPKSISTASRHDLVADAAKILLDRGIENFVVYFWLGNHVRGPVFNDLQAHIQALGPEVSKRIIFQKHPFLEFHDVIKIWEHMDFALQIAKHDQLSTSLLEPMFYKKEVVVTDIAPYRFLEKTYGVNLNLVPLEAGPIANQMADLIAGKRTEAAEMEKRSEVVADAMNFEQNVYRMLEAFTGQSFAKD